jgi:ABC-type branched-subunit amino acid transport system ATPase component
MILTLKNINFSFSGKNHLINNLNLELEERKIYSLMGANGSGKTTLFNIITGFIKPQAGQIFFKDINITKLSTYKINQAGIGRTFQDLRLISKLTVKENVILAMQNKPGDNWYNGILPGNFLNKVNREFDKKAEEIIEQFFLDDVKKSLAGEISYGQQKLLTLASCVANGASLFLVDEAVAGVQPEYRNKISMILKNLKELGKTILIIEHNTDFIGDISDRIFFLYEGNISAFENIEVLRNDKRVMEAYI